MSSVDLTENVTVTEPNVVHLTATVNVSAGLLWMRDGDELIPVRMAMRDGDDLILL